MHRLRKIVSKSPDLMQLQAAVNDVVEDLATVKILEGVSVTAAVATAGTTIPHTLNRQPQGWFVTDLDSANIIYRAAWNSKTITLKASATAAHITFWIF